MLFTNQEMTEAEKLHELGLTWPLQSGLYIWDIQGRIKPASPFQRGVYFLLEADCFVDYFGDLQSLKNSVVWLPTWEQALELLRRDAVLDASQLRSRQGYQLVELYRQLGSQILRCGPIEAPNFLTP